MGIQVSDEQFIEAMKAAVAERGEDYVYPEWSGNGLEDDYHDKWGQCEYSTPSGEPACLIGLALSKIDEDLVPKYGEGNISAYYALPESISDVVRQAANEAQDEQDNEKTWGEALGAFMNFIEESRGKN